MDQVFFSVKRAHHAGLGFLRRFLAKFGLTPARFDLLTALDIDCTQKGVARILGLARSTVSEMLARLEELGFISRQRHRRTKAILLTEKGLEVMQRAIDAGLNSGLVPLSVDAMLVRRDVEADPFQERLALEDMTARIRGAFCDDANPDLYFGWHRDEWINVLLRPPGSDVAGAS